MTDTTPNPVRCVIADTSFLRGINPERNADWHILLRLSRARKIKIYISYITREEWRTSQRDMLIADRARAMIAFKSLTKSAAGLFVRDGVFFRNLDETDFSSIERINEASEQGILKYICLCFFLGTSSHADDHLSPSALPQNFLQAKKAADKQGL